MHRSKAITVESIDALMPFIETFEQPDFVAAQWVSEPGVIYMDGNYEYHEQVHAFRQTLYDKNWIIPFDWPRWKGTAVKYVADPGELESADAEIVRRLFTAHIRQERFCEGHLAAMFKNGHILALLRRLRKIREQMGDRDSEGVGLIDRFTGDHDFLSNFHPSPIEVDGIVYPTVEHAFQAAKTFDIEDKRALAAATTPGNAKRKGRKVLLRPDWEQVKVGIMEQLVRLKFTAHSDLQTKLLATGNAALVEGNNWNDRFWGVCRGNGRNELGKILMKIRSELGRRGKP